MEKCKTLEGTWMISSSNVLSNEKPMFWESNACKTILDNGDKSKDSIEHH